MINKQALVKFIRSYVMRLILSVTKNNELSKVREYRKTL